ncbi:hypothetical protein [Enhygromyxa salina]|uniref:hypothetical protein n=1 Tax=Enhygromyxa salina TaxID=215803 RepID=UPI0011B20DAB|nr:hypothetical protein [Enhygromyxa salina]
MLHQGILSVFCDDPWLPFDLLGLARPSLGTLVDRRTEVDSLPTDAKSQPVGLPDLVLCAREPGDPRRGVVICIEVQLERDEAKRYSIPFYQAALAKRHQLPCWVFVVSFSPALSAAVVAWSEGPPPRVEAEVIDAGNVPVPTSVEQAIARPTAAVLAAALHGYGGDLNAARLGIQACGGLPDETRLRYTRTILAALSKRRRELLIKELPVQQRDKLWEIERQSGTFLLGVEQGLEQGLEQGREQGREQGLEQGREQGLEQGREQGRRETLVELILALLEVRGIAVDRAAEARIRGCEALVTLQSWARGAREVSDVHALFEEE